MKTHERKLRRLLLKTARLLNVYGCAVLNIESELGRKIVSSERGDEMLKLHMELHKTFPKYRNPTTP